jgi:hypothetical protein
MSEAFHGVVEKGRPAARSRPSRTALRGVLLAPRGQRGGRRHRDGSRDALRVGVRHLGRQRGLLGDGLQARVEPRPERRDPHRRAIAQAALTGEQFARRLRPAVRLLEQAGKEFMHAVAVSAGRVRVVAEPEGEGQLGLPDLAVLVEDPDDAERHRRVVGPVPVGLLRGAPGADLLVRPEPVPEEREPALPEGVAEGQAFEAAPGGCAVRGDRRGHGARMPGGGGGWGGFFGRGPCVGAPRGPTRGGRVVNKSGTGD